MKGFFAAATGALALLPSVFAQNITINGDVQVNINVYTCSSANGCGIYPHGYICDSNSPIHNLPGFAKVCSGCSIQSYEASVTKTVSVAYESNTFYICQSQTGCGSYANGFIAQGSQIEKHALGFVVCYSCQAKQQNSVVESIAWYQCMSSNGCGKFAFHEYCLGGACVDVKGLAICSSPSTAVVVEASYYICKSDFCGIYPRGFVVSHAEYVVIQASCPGFVVCTECVITQNSVYIANATYICAFEKCDTYSKGEICVGAACNLAVKGFLLCSVQENKVPEIPAYPVNGVTVTVAELPTEAVSSKSTSTVLVTKTAAPIVCPTAAQCPPVITCPAPVTVTVTANACAQTQFVVPSKAAAPVVVPAKNMTNALPANKVIPQINGASKVGAAFSLAAVAGVALLL